MSILLIEYKKQSNEYNIVFIGFPALLETSDIVGGKDN